MRTNVILWCWLRYDSSCIYVAGFVNTRHVFGIPVICCMCFACEYFYAYVALGICVRGHATTNLLITSDYQIPGSPFSFGFGIKIGVGHVYRF